MRTLPFVFLLSLAFTLSDAVVRQSPTFNAARQFRHVPSSRFASPNMATPVRINSQTNTTFTDLFRAYVARYNPHMSDAQVASLLIAPPPALAAATMTVDSLDAADQLFVPWKQSTLWAASPTSPFAPVDDLDAVFRAQRVPPTILLIPGFMGELLKRPLFEDIVNTSSVFSNRFAAALQQCGDCADGVDDVFHMRSLDVRSQSLADLILAWSVDLPEGVPAVQFILFLAPLLSMESFSLTYAAISDVLYRRMSKIMRLMEKTTKFELYPVGYSRSGGIAMEMAQDPKWQSLPIRGVVSLAGVHWGAHFADCGLGMVGHEGDLCTMTRRTLSALHVLNSSLVPKLSHFADNAGHIMACLMKMVEGALKTPSAPEMKRLSQIFPSLKKLWHNLIFQVLQDLNLAKPISGYADIIRRTQVLLTHVLTAVETMVTDERMQWFATHTLPINMPYYVLLNAQPDADEEVSDDNCKTHKLHPDSFSLRQEYYVVLEASGQQFNDGQVAASRASLLPALHRKLNPVQEDYAHQVQWLGIFNSTHWSSAFPVAVETKDGWVAPFPRAAAIMAIAHKIALDANARTLADSQF